MLAESSKTEEAIALARLHPTAFARMTKRDYAPAEVHWRIGTALRRIEQGVIDRLMLFVPPRFGKSELSSIRFPAWYLGRHPDRRVIACSYSMDLASDFGRKARNLVQSPEYGDIFPGVALSEDSTAMARWDIAGRDGGYIAAGVGGPITGRGAHLLLIDDPVKNRDDAESALVRKNIWDWYTDVAYTRLEEGGAIVLIMTRWHEDDLAGRLLKAMRSGNGDQWELVTLPAVNEDGVALWPEKYDQAAMERIRIVEGPRSWAALYLQRPQPAEGGIFNRGWWQYLDEPPPLINRTIQVWDTAFKVKTSADYSVCATWQAFERGYYLKDLWRARVDYPTLKDTAQQLYRHHQPSHVYVEDAASGQSLIQDLRKTTKLPVVAVPVDSDKYSRASSITGIVAAGQVYLPRHAPWLYEFVEEHAAFPSGEHDDQVDTTSMALRYLRDVELRRPSQVHDTLGLVHRPRRDNPLGLDMDNDKYRDRDSVNGR